MLEEFSNWHTLYNLGDLSRQVIFRASQDLHKSSLNLIIPAHSLENARERPPIGTPAPVKTPLAPTKRIPSTQIPCERCGKVAAYLIFADYAREVGGLEDCAHKMYSIYKKVNVPTWVIGVPLGIPSDLTPALTLKVWPKRQEAKPISPADFNAELDKLLAKHC